MAEQVTKIIDPYKYGDTPCEWKDLNLHRLFPHLDGSTPAAGLILKLTQEEIKARRAYWYSEDGTSEQEEFTLANLRRQLFEQFYYKVVGDLNGKAVQIAINKRGAEAADDADVGLLACPSQIINSAGGVMLAEIANEPEFDPAEREELTDLALEIGSLFRQDLHLNFFEGLQDRILPTHDHLPTSSRWRVQCRLVA